MNRNNDIFNERKEVRGDYVRSIECSSEITSMIELKPMREKIEMFDEVSLCHISHLTVDDISRLSCTPLGMVISSGYLKDDERVNT